MDKIRLIIVEDDPNWIAAMTLFLELEEDLEIVAVAKSYDEAIETCISTDADVILMDINLSENELSGIYATAEILCHKEIKIIMLTSLLNELIIRSAFAAGAVNYVLKTAYKSIPSVIRQTLQSITPNEVLARDYLRLRIQEILSPLTSTEKEVFQMLSEGKSKKDIADSLFISENTLKNHINHILKKLEAESVKDAIEKLKRKGFVRK